MPKWVQLRSEFTGRDRAGMGLASSWVKEYTALVESRKFYPDDMEVAFLAGRASVLDKLDGFKEVLLGRK